VTFPPQLPLLSGFHTCSFLPPPVMRFFPTWRFPSPFGNGRTFNRPLWSRSPFTAFNPNPSPDCLFASRCPCLVEFLAWTNLDFSHQPASPEPTGGFVALRAKSPPHRVFFSYFSPFSRWTRFNFTPDGFFR